jgi:hypothetical protein
MFSKSLLKAFRDVGIVAGSLAATAGVVALQNPEVLAPLAVAGPFGTLAFLAIPVAAKALQDYLKHRGEAPEGE